MSLDEITNFVTLSDRLGTAGQPTVQQYESVRDAGYEVVINLATPDSKNAISNESEVVTSHGLSYFQIPVVWLEPTKDNFRLFTDLMDALEGRKVFVHCVVNHRVSAFVFLYRTIRKRMDPVETKADMEQLWTPHGVWEEFVDTILAEHDVDYFSI